MRSKSSRRSSPGNEGWCTGCSSSLEVKDRLIGHSVTCIPVFEFSELARSGAELSTRTVLRNTESSLPLQQEEIATRPQETKVRSAGQLPEEQPFCDFAQIPPEKKEKRSGLKKNENISRTRRDSMVGPKAKLLGSRSTTTLVFTSTRGRAPVQRYCLIKKKVINQQLASR